MAVSFDQALALKNQYTELYRTRHEAFRSLRRYWHGDYWNRKDGEHGRPIVSIFRDLGGAGNNYDTGPDLKLVYNIIHEVVNKYQTYLSPLPLIRMWADRETDTAKAQATLKQRFLYGFWDASNMDRLNNNIGWYLPLMGDCYLAIHPDFDTNIPRALIRSPEFAFPIPSFDKHGENAVIFAWSVHESVATANFKEYQAPIQEMRQKRQGRFKRGQAPDQHVQIIEYSDQSEWHRWITPVGGEDGEGQGAQEINGVVHNLGFNLFDHLKFIEVPDEVFGHGAVEQAINMNEMSNALLSLMYQAILENVFPRLILENPQAAPEEIESGPGAVIPLNAGGKAYYLQPEGPAIQGQADFMRNTELQIRNATGMPGVNFGESPATSIVTGKAVNELQGAGTGSMIEMVQGTGIGVGISNLNSKAITIAQRMFRDDNMLLFGQAYNNMTALVPERFQLNIKGKQLIGSPRNDVIFAPALNDHEKLVMMLQGLGGGLWSKKYAREQIGVVDAEQMREEVLAEQVEDMVLAAVTNQFQQAGAPEQGAEAVEDQAFAYLQGSTSTPHPLLSMPGGAGGGSPAPAPPGAPPGGPSPGGGPLMGQLPGGGQTVSPPLALAPGAAPPVGAPPSGGAPASPGGPAAGASGAVTVADAISAFKGVQLQGKAWLVGEIAARGTTSGPVEIAITDKADQPTLQQAAPFPVMFHIVTGEPKEQSVPIG